MEKRIRSFTQSALFTRVWFCSQFWYNGKIIEISPNDFFKEVLLVQLSRWAYIECNLEKRGYYPKGQGIIEIIIK